MISLETHAKVVARCDELQEENRQLRELLACESPLSHELQRELSPVKQAILGVLGKRAGAPVPLEVMLPIVWPDRYIDTTVLKVHICVLRKQLLPFGIGIDTHFMRGYSISPENWAKCVKKPTTRVGKRKNAANDQAAA